MAKEFFACYDRIAESLSAVKVVYFKIDQRTLRNRIKKPLKSHDSKRNPKEKASGVEVEHSEVDDLMLDIYDQHKQIENETSEISEKVKIAKGEHKLAAEKARDCAVERLTETHKRNFQSPKISNNRRSSSGGDTIAYLKEKPEKDFALRQEEINFRKQELDISKSKEEASQKQIAQLIENAQQQTNTLKILLTKMVGKVWDYLFVDIKVICILHIFVL